MGNETSTAALEPSAPTVTKQELLDWYYLWWNTKGILPSIEEIARAFNTNLVLIQNLVDDDGFRRSLVVRGVPLSKKSVLTPDQLKCIAIITDPTESGGLKTRLRKAQVPYSRYQSWMAIPEFRDSVNKLAERILDNSLADVNTGLVQAAVKGDVPAIKFFYEVTGRYDPANKQIMDVMSVLAQVVEIIQKHVKDAPTLESIATELTMLSAVAAPGANRMITQ